MSLEISTDLDRLDRARIHDWLSDSYWAADRSTDVMDRAIDNSLCFGAYDKAGQLLGMARVVTDGAVFAYLCDVVVDPDSRGKGIGKALLSAVDAHPALQGSGAGFSLQGTLTSSTAGLGGKRSLMRPP